MHTKKKLSGIIAGLAAVLAAVSLTACGQKENAADTQPADTKVAAQTTETTIPEVQGDVEETAEVSEDPTANLSNEEWVESLNLDRAVFLVFNSITNERKVLEDGQEYTLAEGDELAYIYPLDWENAGFKPLSIYKNFEFKYKCVFMDLDYDSMDNNTEIVISFKDADGNEAHTTLYPSK